MSLPNKSLFGILSSCLDFGLSSLFGEEYDAYKEVLELLCTQFGLDSLKSLYGLVLLQVMPQTDLSEHPVTLSRDTLFGIARCTLHSNAVYCLTNTNAETESERPEGKYRRCTLEQYSVAKLCSRAGIYPDMLLYLNKDPPMFVMVYYIALDPALLSVVFCLRGTYSLNDVVSDMISYSGRFEYLEEDGLVHAGMYKTALRTLEHALPQLDEAMDRHPSHRLIVTGHSLGGGVATLITLMLKERRPNWDIHCYTIGPAATVSYNIATMPAIKGLITSAVFDNDVVPSLSLSSVKQLVARMNKVIGQVTFDPIKLVTKLASGVDIEQSIKEVLDESGVVIDGSVDPSLFPLPLLPAGNILHIRRQQGDSFSVMSVDNTRFSTINVKKTMVADHVPANYIISTKRILFECTGEDIPDRRKQLLNECLDILGQRGSPPAK